MTSFQEKERIRQEAFNGIWDTKINDVFSDVASVYDRANDFASLGTLKGYAAVSSTPLTLNQARECSMSAQEPMLSALSC